jgi:hypothetical protein
MQRILLPFILLSAVRLAYPQAAPLKEDEAMLRELFEDLYNMESDLQKRQQNDSILQTMTRILAFPGSFEYPFDSLSRIGNIRPPDHAFRIFTWNIPLSGFRNEYHGIIQMAPSKKSSCKVFILRDQSRNLEDLIHTATGARDWPGVLYYQVLRNKAGREVVYTLIGFNFHDRFSDKKVIDVLSFDKNREPVFGRPIFQTENGIQHRVVFEYSGDVVMTVRYNPDIKMIVYDHLAPIEPELAGHPRYYAPDFSYDGYKWKGGMWVHQSDIDVRNR